MPEFLDLTGQKFGRLTVIRRVENSSNGSVRWYCKCDCGGESIAPSYYLRTTQKGCKKCTQMGHPTHGLSKLPEYKIWVAMKQRCTNKNDENYHHYGGRGIVVCDRWLEGFEFFLQDMGKRPDKKLTLERRDNNLGYNPDNCYWATRKQQARNFRKNVMLEYKGQSKCISEWAEIYGLRHDTIASRLESGCSIEDALTKKVKEPGKPIMVNGKLMSIKQAERELGFGSGTITHRLKSGYTEEEAVTLPIGCNKQKKIMLNGELVNLSEAERRLGLANGQIGRRLKSGYSLEEAIGLPKHGKKKKDNKVNKA